MHFSIGSDPVSIHQPHFPAMPGYLFFSRPLTAIAKYTHLIHYYLHFLRQDMVQLDSQRME
jgi:hypothetical protein